MTVLPELVEAFVGLVSARMPGVQVSAEPPAEGAAREAVFLEEYWSDFDWRCLGGQGDQRETIHVRWAVRVYEEGTHQRDSARVARVRCFELLSRAQEAITDDGALSHQIGGVVSWGHIARWRVRLDPGSEKGWVATGRAVLEAVHYP